MFGQGLLKGMAITLRRFFGRPNTVEYPEERIPMTARFRGGPLMLERKKCIACSLCSLACPNQAIELATAAGEDKKRYLTSYWHHTGLCLYCNLCVEACPTQAIAWSRDYERSVYRREALSQNCLGFAAAPEGGQADG